MILPGELFPRGITARACRRPDFFPLAEERGLSRPQHPLSSCQFRTDPCPLTVRTLLRPGKAALRPGGSIQMLAKRFARSGSAGKGWRVAGNLGLFVRIETGRRGARASAAAFGRHSQEERPRLAG